MKNDHIIELLHNAGLKATNSRIAVLKILAGSSKPLTHRDVFQDSSCSGIDRVSVYRILEALVEKGLVHRIETSDRAWRFAFCDCESRGHCHPHFICAACGTVECLKDMEMPPTTLSKPGYSIFGLKLYIQGICAKCNYK